MKIFFDGDRHGRKLAKQLFEFFSELYDCSFLGKLESDPYPLVAANMAQKVLETPNSYGVLVCHTGIGMSIIANKFNGIYANNCKTIEECLNFKQKNNGNILCLSESEFDFYKSKIICDTFFNAEFDESNRFRIDLIEKIFPIKIENQIIKK